MTRSGTSARSSPASACSRWRRWSAALAFDPATLIVARAVQGIGAAVAAPTGLALIATTYAVGHARNQAMAVSAAMQGVGSVLGLVLGGALTVISWRLAFLINVPIGIVIIAIAVTPARRDPPRTAQARRHRRAAGDAGLHRGGAGVHAGPAARLDRPVGDRRGRRPPSLFFGGFLVVERTADNPLVPFSVFDNRNRVMTFVSLFLAGGVLLTLTVMIGLYVQDVLGYSALRAGICFIPFAVALGLGNVAGGPAGAADRAALADHRRRAVRAGRDALRLDAEPHDPVLPGPVRADRRRRLRDRRDLGDPAAVRGGRGRARGRSARRRRSR